MALPLDRHGRQPPWPRRLGIAAIALLAIGGGAAASAYAFLRASLPTLDGKVVVAGVDAATIIRRDAAGVTTLHGTSRDDVAFATGYAHAQDRFFQMDLLRRAASGELSALLGPRLLPVDRDRRIHRFAARAHDALAALAPRDRALLDRYVAGVNAGLASLAARPFEYAVLRTTPKPWRAEDTLLVIWAMYFDLQDDQLHREFSRGWLRDHGTTPEQLAFLLPTSTGWDAPLDAPHIDEAPAPIPAAAPPWFGRPVAATVATTRSESGDLDGTATAAVTAIAFAFATDADSVAVGSNNWAVAGSRSRDGAAIVSVDMHLSLRLPHIWYRAALEVAAPGAEVERIVGVTLPGAPIVVAGSNGRVAWGFTNSYGDYLDLIELELDPKDASRYRHGANWEALRFHDETIEVNGAPSETVRVADSDFGPVWPKADRRYAVHWIAHDAGAVNFALREMEGARDVGEALAIGQRAGIPAQNMVAGDRAGHIGWTVAGPLPGRDATWDATFSYSASAASTAAAASASASASANASASASPTGSAPSPWLALRPPGEHPLILDPPSGQLWTANARQLAGSGYERIGDGGADLGARARQVRDGVTALGTGTDEHGVYGIALDDRAIFMGRWHDRALKALQGSEGDANAAAHPQRAAFRRLLETRWTGHASVDSVAYRLTRGYYNALYRRLFGSADEAMQKIDRQAGFGRASPRWPALIGRLVDAQPDGWLPAGSATWRDFQLAAVDDAIAEITKDGARLEEATWGRRNTAAIAHPMAAALPFGTFWLAAPKDALPGDNHMPRVASPDFGQSERMVIAPGHEDRALFDMPGGQSGHPLSPYFLAGHADWVAGRPGPLLPGPAAHALMLAPVGSR